MNALEVSTVYLEAHYFWSIKQLPIFNLLPVYLFIGEHVALVDFVKALHELVVHELEEYMIISIDDFIFDPESNAQEYTSRSKSFKII